LEYVPTPAVATVVQRSVFTPFLNTDFPYNDLEYFPDMPYSQCESSCLSRGGCNGYTLNKEPGRDTGCWLKSSMGNKTPDSIYRDSYVLTSYLESNPV